MMCTVNASHISKTLNKSVLCDYLIDATEKVFDIDLAGKELWNASEPQIPIYCIKDGAFFVHWGFSYLFSSNMQIVNAKRYANG
jgi:hypothetical protein